MQMTEVRDKLQALQNVLSEKYEIEKNLRDAPKQLDAQNELLARLQKEFLEKNASYDECKERVLKLEVELSEAEKSREEGEKGMDNIATHREYEALDKQITEATQKEAEIRKELDKEKRQLNDLSESISSDKSIIDATSADINTAKASIEKQEKKFNTQLEKLSKKEEEVRQGLDNETVEKFKTIIQRNSEGIVAVKNGVCEGCHMILPAQFVNEVRDGDEILFCPYCSRILFYQESDENEENYYAMAEAGSLSDFEDYLGDERVDDDEESDDENYEEKSSEYDEDVDETDEDLDEDEDDSEEEESEEN
ncbi:MAG: nucleic acid-binding protein [Treponema sp.]|nr:nucleic acid-binding protein [Treponema sp.]